MVFSTGCESGSFSHLCPSLSRLGSCGASVAKKTFSVDNMLSIFGSTGLSPPDKVCRFDMSFN